MSLTKQEFDVLAAGGSVSFNLPADPGVTSQDGIFFQNLFFRTANGDSSSTAQGLTSLVTLQDIGNFQRDNTQFIARNSSVTVGDDFGSTFGTDSLFSISGPSASLTLLGEEGNSTRIRMASEDGNSTTATMYFSDGAQVVVDNPEGDRGRGISVGVNFEAFLDDGMLRPSGQSVDATLVIEGANTSVSVLNSNGDRGSLDIGRVFQSEDGLADTTTNRSAEGTVIVRDGADVNIRQFVGIGTTDNVVDATATGALIVEGAGTTFTLGQNNTTGNEGFMRVGEEGGTGFLVIREGAQFSILENNDRAAGIQLSGSSERAGGEGHGVVTGTGTRLLVENGSISVGRNVGTASFEISDGARLDARSFRVAEGGIATATITGSDTEVFLTDGTEGQIEVGRVQTSDPTIPSADGTLTISDGAQVEVRNFIGVGDADGLNGVTATGALIIEGADTTVTVGSESRTGENGFMRLGDGGGTGHFTLRDGAALTLLAGEEFGGGLQLSGSSDQEGGEAHATITGTGTHLIAEKDAIIVGRNGGTATFNIADGAIVDTMFFQSGREGEGHTVIEGEGTELNLSGAQVTPEFAAFLEVGRDVDGTMTVRDGADVTITGDGGAFPGFSVGRNDGATGVMTVTGAGTTVTIDGATNVDAGGGETGFMRAGRNDGSEGTINVLAGAVIANSATGLLVVAQEDGSKGAINVDGAGSILDFGATAALSEDNPGARGNSVVTVSNGGLLRGGEIINNGILDITSGGTVDANLVQDNIMRSSSGVENTTIEGDLTVRTAGFGMDTSGTGVSLTHDTYAATGNVSLEGTLTVLATSAQDFVGQSLELITGNTLTVSDTFSVRLVNFDANALTEVDEAALFTANESAVELEFTATSTGLTVDFSSGEQTGSTASDTLNGTDLAEAVDAQGGDDNVDSGNGNDTVDAGTGNDTVDAGRGDDIVTAGDGDDDVRAGTGEDSVEGGQGDDFLRGGRGEDTLEGGLGDDRIVGQRNADIIDGGDGNDNLKGGGGNDTIDGGAGNDFIKGGTRADVLNGGDGDDRIFANSFADVLNGNAGNDLLNAGGDEDTLNGGTGNDTLKGGGGADTFIFDADTGADVVLDFEDDTDMLQISTALTGGSTDAAFVVSTFGSVVNGRAVLDFGGGNVITFNGVGDETVLADDMTFF